MSPKAAPKSNHTPPPRGLPASPPLPPAPKLPDETKRRGDLVLRTLPVLLIPFLALTITGLILRATMDQLPPRPGPGSPLIPLIPIVILFIFFSALITLVRLGRTTVSALVLISTWTLITTFAALQDGVTTNWPALLIVPICVAGLLLDGAASISLAALATLLVGSLAWLETQGLLTPHPPPPQITTVLPIIATGFWAGLFWTVAALTYLLAGSLQRALDQSRAQASALSTLSSQLEARVAEQTAELAQRTARAEALYEISRALTSTLELDQVLGLITEQAARLLRFDATLVLLEEDGGESFELVSAYRPPPALAATLIDQGATLHQVIASQQPTVLPLTIPDQPSPISALILPMCYAQTVAGLLVLVDVGHSAERSVDDMALAEGFADHAAVAIANAQLLAQAREAATLEERTRLAREIHDTLAQGLTGIVVQLGAGQRALAAAPEEALEHLGLAQRMAREALAEARRSVWNLRAPALERGDLSDALQGLVSRPLRPELQAGFRQEGDPWPLPPGVESALLRVGQEALVNVAKHARATEVSLLLAYTPEGVALRVHDNGVGFHPDVLQQPARDGGPWGGFGLLGMRERLGALGGTLTLRNNGGAEVVATVPRNGKAKEML